MEKDISHQKNRLLCHGCDDCCRYIAVEIDRPTAKSDYQNIIWFLLHKNVRVYIDWENDWLLEFVTPCKELDSQGLCKNYANRPGMCRDYNQKDCTKYNAKSAEKISFNCADDFKRYLKKKNIDWELKNQSTKSI